MSKNKTDRKNKTNLVLNWPNHGSLFTIKDLLAANPEFKEITLRVRVDKAVKKENVVVVVGHKNVGKGRPTMILTMAPVTQEILDAAYASGIQPPDTTPAVKLPDSDLTIPISTSEHQPLPTDITMDVNVIQSAVITA